MLTLREMMVELILFSYDEEDLLRLFQLTEREVSDLADQDLLELYDQTLLREI